MNVANSAGSSQLPRLRLLRRYAPPKKVGFAENNENDSKYWGNRELSQNGSRKPFSSRRQPRRGAATRNDVRAAGTCELAAAEGRAVRQLCKTKPICGGTDGT